MQDSEELITLYRYEPTAGGRARQLILPGDFPRSIRKRIADDWKTLQASPDYPGCVARFFEALNAYEKRVGHEFPADVNLIHEGKAGLHMQSNHLGIAPSSFAEYPTSMLITIIAHERGHLRHAHFPLRVKIHQVLTDIDRSRLHFQLWQVAPGEEMNSRQRRDARDMLTASNELLDSMHFPPAFFDLENKQIIKALMRMPDLFDGILEWKTFDEKDAQLDRIGQRQSRLLVSDQSTQRTRPVDAKANAAIMEEIRQCQSRLAVAQKQVQRLNKLMNFADEYGADICAVEDVGKGAVAALFDRFNREDRAKHTARMRATVDLERQHPHPRNRRQFVLYGRLEAPAWHWEVLRDRAEVALWRWNEKSPWKRDQRVRKAFESIREQPNTRTEVPDWLKRIIEEEKQNSQSR